jgi:hypothetical protein
MVVRPIPADKIQGSILRPASLAKAFSPRPTLPLRHRRIDVEFCQFVSTAEIDDVPGGPIARSEIILVADRRDDRCVRDEQPLGCMQMGA